MNSRLVALVEGVKSIASACSPVLSNYKVSYFKKTLNKETNMYDSAWTQEVVEAYNREEAARQINPKFRPGYNCFVTRVFK